jgi:hypothetical protein
MQVGIVPDIEDFRYDKFETKESASTKRVPASSSKKCSPAKFRCFFKMIGRIIIFGYSISVYVGCAYIVHSLSLKRIIINVKSQLLHAFICCFKCGLLSLVCAVKLSDHIPLPPSPHGYGDIFHIDHLVVNVLVSCYYSCNFSSCPTRSLPLHVFSQVGENGQSFICCESGR